MVKFTMAIFRKKNNNNTLITLTSISQPIFNLLHTHIKYYSMLNIFEFKPSRTKVKVKVAILEKIKKNKNKKKHCYHSGPGII